MANFGRAKIECEVLLPHISRRGVAIMRAMVDAARHVGVRCVVTETGSGIRCGAAGRSAMWPQAAG